VCLLMDSVEETHNDEDLARDAERVAAAGLSVRQFLKAWSGQALRAFPVCTESNRKTQTCWRL
jgi:hypothetical protein